MNVKHNNPSDDMMNILHINPHTKKKVMALPVTGNYLIPESGRLRWAEPNDSWRIMSHSGRQKMLVSNIRYDDTDHSPDLWLYSLLTVDEKDAINNKVVVEEYGKEPKPVVESMLMEGNRVHLDLSRKWYVRQFITNPDRSGISRFAGLPLNAWRLMWRRTIAFEEIEIFGMPSNQMKIMFGGLNFNAFLKWPELQSDFCESLTTTRKDGLRLHLSTTILPWLGKNCREGFVPFSDYETMFPSETDEFIYSVDIAALS
jgi:hypothetical protein